MTEWVHGNVVAVQHWADELFSITLHAPVSHFTAGQFTKLALDIDGQRVQRAYSYVNAPGDPNLEFYMVRIPHGKLTPRLSLLSPGATVMLSRQASGFFVLEEVPDCNILWMLATGTAIGPYLSILQQGEDLQRFRCGTQSLRSQLPAFNAATATALWWQVAYPNCDQPRSGGRVLNWTHSHAVRKRMARISGRFSHGSTDQSCDAVW